MGFDTFFHYLSLILQVFVVNLLLSGDNAVVIALACRSLPPEMTRRAMLLGIEAAIVLRILLTLVAAALMRIPLLKLAGGVALAVIAVKLTVGEREKSRSGDSSPVIPVEFWSAVGTIFVADLVMSVDNVVALAAVAQGSIVILSIGLLMSVPFLLYGSLFVTSLLRRHPLLKRGGGAMLGWLAGDIAISDPMIADWVNQQSPALTVVVPILAVVFVVALSRIMDRTQAAAYALRPRRQRGPAAISPPPPPVAAPPVAATADVPPPSRDKHTRRIAWIVVAISAVLLWLFIKSLSLDRPGTAPAIHWTAPTGTR
jgi:YjbE family integral membrane protein